MPEESRLPREQSLVRTMVEMADTLVDDFDMVELLTRLVDRCVEVLDVEAAGLMLVSPGGELHLVASSSETIRDVELFELQAEEGPCLDAYRSGVMVINQNLETVNGRWPRFAPVALGAGYRSVHAIPMRLRSQTIGALNLFRADEVPLDEADTAAGQALADMATIAILQHRAAVEAQLLNEQLSLALNSRVAIEQAKGIMAATTDVDMEKNFSRLRAHARNHNLRLADVAQSVIDRTVDVSDLDPL